ncbi:hypothetical protein [Actinophytocola oryzae]|uniref:hypothetical protein n=1 Tax=Actinophytocola oryzae TaxID=502181 RepID=UPI0010628FB5|nr:hypothetical protein [Actinophytocola oryzae]
MRSDHARGRDDTTRYLCAAAHLDDRFADRAIREFLTEPTRAAPPVAGVRAGAVLAEAVAARARRKVRDTLVVTLFAGVLVTLSLSLLVGWLLVGVIVFLRRSTPGRGALPAVGGGLVAIALLILLFRTSEDVTSYSYGVGLTAAAVLAVGLLVVLLAVLVVDEYVVWHHIEVRFLRGFLLTDPSPDALSSRSRRVFLFGAEHFLAQLRRCLRRHQWMADPATPDDAVQVVVTRGPRVFVGAGEPHGPWSLAVPLRPRSSAEDVRPLCAGALYEGVARAVRALRGEFADLRVTERVVVAAAGLVENVERAGDFLADPGAAPYPLLRGQRVRELRDRPLGWAAYYLVFQFEARDRDVVVSTFLHLAVRDATLHVEWVPCVLPPLKREYSAIDTTPDSPLLPVVRAVLRFLVLPMTVPARLRTVCSVIRPRRRAPGTLTADMYGVAHSLRELAADTGSRSHPGPGDRVKVLEGRLTSVLRESLAEAGYEAVVPGGGGYPGRRPADPAGTAS